MKTLYAQHTKLSSKYLDLKIKEFLKEDQANNDLTTQISTLNNQNTQKAQLIAQQNLVFSGKQIINYMFQNCAVTMHIDDGDICADGDIIATITGGAAQLLSHERVLLNLIQRLSGITSITQQYVKILNNSKIKILDTRKTTPGLRLFEKHAVNIGGGYNHRLDLFDGIMFKDNHLTIIKNLNDVVNQIKRKQPNKKIQIEVDTFVQLKKLIKSLLTHVDAILLDNMNISETKQCISLIREKFPQCFIESSGGINLKTISNYQTIDVDGISVGALTHQAVSKNIKFEFE